MIVLVASLLALGVLGACVARATAATDESRATRATRAALAAFAGLLAVELSLALADALTAPATLAGLCALAFAAVVWARKRPPAGTPVREPWTAADVALGVALGAAFGLRLWAGLHKTSFLYDTLSYHLHTPVTWMHARRVDIVPALFGSPEPAYAPGNLELWFLFLMAPLRSDALAAVGQLPLAALAAGAIVAAVRESGGRRDAALGAALAFLLIPEIWQQVPTAMVDLGMAAFLLAALPFLSRLGRRVTRADLLALGAAVGLAAGTKVAGAMLGLPFVLGGAIAARRRGATARDLLSAAAVAAGAGGFWYARNLATTGNPIYPVAALGLPGLYDGRAMRAWDYHLPIADLAALGGLLVAAGIGFAGATALALARAWRSTETLLVSALVALFWLVVPYQESRFLFAAFGVGAVALGRGVGRVPVALGAGALAVAVVGALVEWPTPDRLALLPAAAAGALFHAGCRRLSMPARRTVLGVGAGALGAALVATLAIGLRDAARVPGHSIGDETDAAWSWFRANVRDARVAYTGTNLAFPLSGERLSNEVSYVNVTGRPGDRLHDLPRPAPLSPTPEPSFYRDGARFETWLHNLRVARTQVLFVAALYPIVARGIAADADGFPIERAWADAHPALFQLRYASTAARVYAVVAP